MQRRKIHHVKKVKRSGKRESRNFLIPVFSIVIGLFLFVLIVKFLSFGNGENGSYLGASTKLARDAGIMTIEPTGIKTESLEITEPVTDEVTTSLTGLEKDVKTMEVEFNGSPTQSPRPTRSPRRQEFVLKTGSDGASMIERGSISASSHFPLSVDPTTNVLTVTTPAGVKQVTVLPDVAVANLLANHVVDQLATGSSATTEGSIQLKEKDGIPVFEIAGKKRMKMLGILPVLINKMVTVSAQSGVVVDEKVTGVDKIIQTISF